MPLVLGNQKLGNIHHWSIRSGADCPGKTDLCSKLCYAAHGHFTQTNVKAAHKLNRQLSDSPYFVEWMNIELARQDVRTLRLHSDGDFYSAAYAKRWYRICQANPQIAFYAYTRSWRVKKIRYWLEKMARLNNFSMWYSVDKETGWPGKRVRGIRLAYMQVAADDIPKCQVHLIFRVKKLRSNILKWLPLARDKRALICPPENGVTDITCEKCQYCFRSTVNKVSKLPAKFSGARVALPLVV